MKFFLFLLRAWVGTLIQAIAPGAVVQLADVIIPEIYESYTAVNGPELTAFFEAGVAVRNAALDNAFAAGGVAAHLPFWKDLDATIEPNYSVDDPAVVAVPNKIVASQMIARIADWNQGYSAADLVSELAGSDPMRRIRERFGTYWMRQWQRRVIKTLTGVFAHNVATDNSDMVNDISVADQLNVTNANLFGRQAFTGAVFTLGDHFDEIVAIGVHSIVYKRMVDNDDITFERPSTPDPNVPLSKQQIPYFLGKRVIVDDGLPVVANGAANGYLFTSVLFGAGSIGYGKRDARVPTEIYRRPDQGNGGGIEQLWERQAVVIHPFGHSFTSAAVAGQSPTNAEMATAANWTRVIERKNVPLAFLVTNG